MTHRSGSSNPPARIPSINGLEAFEAVARRNSFSKAADELSITQSAVSHRLSQLEWLLGVPLLSRVGHSVSLTAQGRDFLPHVALALKSLQAGIATMVEPRQRTIRLSLAPALAAKWLVQHLAAFQRTHPEINLDISVTSRMLDIRAGEVDVGLRFGNGDWEGLDAIELIRTRIFPVCSRAYLNAHSWLKQPQDLARATLLRQAVVPWKPWFRAAGLEWPEPVDGPSFSEVSMLIDAAEYSQGIALVLSALIERQLASETLVRLFDIEQTSDRSYYIVTPSNEPLRTEVRALVAWLRETSRAIHGE
ncbi:Glycine cleavage system transcriptional activator (plasmid) [Burkholderia sp. AD24]|nr:Glycine cleavage system transcriptional activator [Burkholderia sp. AD24]